MGKQTRSIFRGLLILTAVAASLGCTRDFKKVSTVRLNAGSYGSMAGALSVSGALEHIAVNVRGPGMDIKTYSWDGHDGAPPPAVISMEVPAGPGRLIQFLGVFKDDTDPQYPYKQFSYGSVIQDLQPGAQNVNISAEIINIGASEAHIAGQYVMYDGASAGTGVYGPTVKLAEEFLAVPEDPPMIVGYSEMFNGWFQAFGMMGVPIQYRRLDNGQILTDDGTTSGIPLDVDYADMNSYNDEVLHVTVPYAYERSCGGGSCDPGDPQELYLGFFGPMATDIYRWITYSSANFTYSQISLIGGGSIDWNNGAGSIEPLSGGVPDDFSGSQFVDYFSFDPNSMENGGHDTIAGFQGPFQLSMHMVSPCSSGTYKSAAGVCLSDYAVGGPGKDLRVEWSYLPGVNVKNATVQGIDGASIYLANQQTCGNDCHEKFKDQNDDGVRCSNMVALGAIHIGDVSAVNQNVNQTFADPAIPYGYYYVYLCPYRLRADNTKEYFNSAGQGWFDAQPPTMMIYGVKGGTDTLSDGFLVGGTPTSGMIVTVGAITNAVNYTVKINSNSNGTTLCGPVTSGSVSIAIPSCSTPLSQGGNYEIEVRAKDATGAVVAGQSMYMTRILTVPDFTITGYSCVQNGSNFDVHLSHSSSNPGALTSLFWNLWVNGVMQSGINMSPYDDMINPWIFPTTAPWGVSATFSSDISVMTNIGGYSYTVYPTIPAFSAGVGCP